MADAARAFRCASGGMEPSQLYTVSDITLRMIDAHLAKLRKRDDISAEEEQAIRGAVSHTRKVPADQVIIRAGQELTESTFLIDGWAARARDLQNGQRQITELHIAGDFIDIHSFTLKRLDHDVLSLAPCTLATVPHDSLRVITEQFPHLTRVYWFGTNLDAAIHREWEVSLGRRSTLAAMAMLFCELSVRLGIIGRVRNGTFDLPLTQERLAECLGITAVHANRTLQELRARQLITLRNRQLTILDQGGLEKAAEFDPSYLYLERKAR
ncbi:MAG: Crp/Fnr family transcriptional regulator [Sphingomicrobium sp.]